MFGSSENTNSHQQNNSSDFAFAAPTQQPLQKSANDFFGSGPSISHQ
jgi:hypothetical protein